MRCTRRAAPRYAPTDRFAWAARRSTWRPAGAPPAAATPPTQHTPEGADVRLAEVAAFLRERGGINPFNEGPHDWTGVVGEPCMKLVEGHLGPVHPWPIEREVRPGKKITIRRSRFAPKAPRRFYFHLLFTVDLGPRAGGELAVCLPREWPLHDRALQKDEFRMPLDLLCQLGSALLSGRRLAHGDLLTRDDPALAGLAMQERLDQWLSPGARRRKRLASAWRAMPKSARPRVTPTLPT